MILDLSAYLPILVFTALAFGLSSALVLVSWLRARSHPNANKQSAYECGFDAFSDTRRQFDIRFYLVAILFIIFDLEIAFLFPWAITLGTTGITAFISMGIFLLILTIGFIYEWKKGALDWE